MMGVTTRNDKDFIMKPKVDYCFKELMKDETVRSGFVADLLEMSPEDVAETTLIETEVGQNGCSFISEGCIQAS